MRNKGSVVGAALTGFALGAVLGILLAPKSGKETREDLYDWMEDMSEELNDRLEDMKEMTKDKYDQLVDTLSTKYSNVKDIRDSEVKDFSEELKNRWERIKYKWNQ